MDTNLAVYQELIGYRQTIATAMQSGTTGIDDWLVILNPQRKIGLNKFVGDIGKAWPQRVTVGAIAYRPAGNTAESDLEQLEPLPFLVVAYQFLVDGQRSSWIPTWPSTRN